MHDQSRRREYWELFCDLGGSGLDDERFECWSNALREFEFRCASCLRMTLAFRGYHKHGEREILWLDSVELCWNTSNALSVLQLVVVLLHDPAHATMSPRRILFSLAKET